MRSWTIHLPPAGIQRRPAVLIPEGFSLGALLFGPLWLLRHRCWAASGIAFLAFALAWLAPAPLDAALPLTFALLLGFHGQDLRRWTLARRGMPVSHVVLGPSEDAAMLRAATLDPVLLPIFAARLG